MAGATEDGVARQSRRNGWFLATSRETDVFPVSVSVSFCSSTPFPDCSRWFIVSCPGNGVITF